MSGIRKTAAAAGIGARWFQHLGHHLLTASLITCCVFWLSTWGASAALDNAMLYAANKLRPNSTPIESQLASQWRGQLCQGELERFPAPKPPILLTISPAEYETAYHNTSPLSRTTLKEALARLVAAEPKVVALDIDISPATPDDDSGRVLDDWLDGIAARAKGPQIVLLVPSFAGTPKLTARQTRWMQDRCAASGERKGILFALPGLPNRSGVILRHSRLYPSLGNVARWSQIYSPDSGAPVLMPSCSAIPRADQVCEVFKKMASIALLRAYFEPSQQCDAAPIDFSWLAPDPESTGQMQDLGRSTPGGPMGGASVFVGGTYDNKDTHATGFGDRPGVLIHAAIYAAQTCSVSHALAFFLEIALGVCLGLLFSAIWSWRNRLQANYHRRLAAGQSGLAAANWLVAAALLWLSFAVAIVLAVLLIQFSAMLLSSGAWLNPVPLVIGMAIDGFVASRAAHTPPHAAMPSAPASWRLWAATHPGLIAGAVLSIPTMTQLFFGIPYGHH